MDIHTGCQVLAITEQGVQTNQGFVQADLIISGIGAQANMQLAQAADLTTGHGILVDEFGRF